MNEDYRGDWLRYEGHIRSHAIWLKHADGSIRTYCGTIVKPIHQRHISKDPRARCRCCVSRIANGYLVPGWMHDLIREHGRGAA